MGATQSTSHPYTLATPKGRLNGIEQRSLSTGRPILHRYTRIPYALPPVGSLRWKPPQALPKDFTFDSGDYTTFGPISPQPHYTTGAALVPNPSAAPEIKNTQSEDCLYLNIWVPASSSHTKQKPKTGWPVQFQIHGGWLQVGDANQSNDQDPFDLFLNTDTPRIIVSVTYRLNILGFLAGQDLASAADDAFAGNYGLWDQRAALEWTHGHISLFGGDPNLITLGGLSAGSHSSILQVFHDSCLPQEKRCVRQAYFWSNAIAVQHNGATSEVLSRQFEELCTVLGIEIDGVSSEEKVVKLRQVKWEDLMAAIPKLKQHTFRASTDGAISDGGFLPPTLLREIHDGTFAARLAAQGTRIMLGEVGDEAQLYKLVNPPASRQGLVTQLGNYYPAHVVERLLDSESLYRVPARSSDGEKGMKAEQWADLFARIVADLQVHASLRGFANSLLTTAEGEEGGKCLDARSVFRYRIAWRAKSLDGWLKPEVGVCHAADTPIWWYSGYRAGYTDEDKEVVGEFLRPFGQFLRGEEVTGWYGEGGGYGDDLKEEGVEKLYRVLGRDGSIKCGVVDEGWERGLEVWNAVWDVQKERSG